MHYIVRRLLLALVPIIPVFLYLFHPTFSFITSCAIIIVVFLVLLGLNRYQYLPIIRKNEEYTQNILDIIFRALESEIKDLRPQCTNLRINIMKVRRSIVKPWERYLKIDYYYGNYSHQELSQIYGLNVGCCGVALVENSQIYYDSIKQHQTILHMTAAQQEITIYVNSILSTPIYSPKDDFERNIIAILNLDSIDGIGITGFDQSEIQEIAANSAFLMNRQLI